MKKSYHEKKKENTLLSYFTKVNQPAKKESLSSIIAKTTQVQSKRTIDLTLDDDDLEILPPQNSTQTSTNSSSQNSFNSLNTEDMKNSSKYNNKGWSVKAVEIGPERSSQDSSLSQAKKPISQFDRIVLNKSRITPKPNYDWIGSKDVRPFGSGIPVTNKTENSPRPVITERSRSNHYTTEQRVKRSWESSFGSSNSSGWEDQSSWKKADNFQWPSLSKKEKLNERKSVQNKFWTKTKGSRVKKEDEMTMASLASNSYGLSSSEPEVKYELSSEQQRVLNMVIKEKQSLFFTGSAGTGKSVLLREIISQLREIYGSMLAVTASTGIAACNINGCTLHSFAGIGLGKGSVNDLLNKIQESPKSKERWMDTKVLIIDEISMVDGELFDKLEAVARILRQNNTPFGGIQLIVTGDFFQLPPVNKLSASKFAFEAKTWTKVVTKTVMLSKVFRQKDETFIKILNEMRVGILSNDAIRTFKSLSRVPEGDSAIEPTELYPLRHEVDESNKRKLDGLSGQMFEFKAQDYGDHRKLDQCIAPTLITLKVSAQVMLLKNLDTDLVNGSIGVVVGFVGHGEYRTKKICDRLRTPQRQRDAVFNDDKGRLDMSIPWPIVQFSNKRKVLFEHESWSYELPGGKDRSTRYQVPLMLAWAMSIHKSQGQTLERVKVDLAKVFEKGQAYVALSRATTLEKLQILNFNPSKVMAHPTVTRFYKTLQTV